MTRIYTVDEYCEGASHFTFADRKHVVMLEDYKKLEIKNAELRCLVLRSIRKHLHQKIGNYWAAKNARILRHFNYYDEAYRKAKNELMDMKCKL